MLVVVAKVALAPLLVGISALIVRRWGQAAGGWLIGLPIVSGPTSMFLYAEHGPGFARNAAQGTLLGLMAGAVFCLTYVVLARRSAWLKTLLIACVVCMAAAFGLSEAHVGLLTDVALTAGVLALVAHRLGSVKEAPSSCRPVSRKSIVTRMALASVIVLMITAGASVLGSRISGILMPLPVISALMASSLHRHDGGTAACGLLSGVTASSWGGAVFFTMVALLIGTTGMAETYLLASLAAAAATLIAISLQKYGSNLPRIGLDVAPQRATISAFVLLERASRSL